MTKPVGDASASPVAGSQPRFTPNGIIESREVLAAAYAVGQRGRLLRHAVFVNRNRYVVEVLCRRVNVDNLADRNAGDPMEFPTCRACLRAVARIERQRP
jgi:hypothetical protein